MLKKIILGFIVNVLSLWLISYFIPSISFSYTALAIGGLVLVVFNLFIKPLLNIVSLPIKLMTFGLFSFVIDVVVLWLLVTYIPGASFSNILELIIGGIALAFVNGLLSFILGV